MTKEAPVVVIDFADLKAQRNAQMKISKTVAFLLGLSAALMR